jgi:hypothetical protein
MGSGNALKKWHLPYASPLPNYPRGGGCRTQSAPTTRQGAARAVRPNVWPRSDGLTAYSTVAKKSRGQRTLMMLLRQLAAFFARAVALIPSG